MKININDLEFRFKFSDNERMPATLTIVVGQFVNRGFKIIRSKHEDSTKKFLLFPPSNKVGNNYIDIVRVPDKDDWHLLEEAVLKKFDEEYDNYLMDKSIKAIKPDNTQENSIDDINFG